MRRLQGDPLRHAVAAEVDVAVEDVRTVEDELFSERFLIRRPLLRAITASSERLVPPVLIIDEVDRADDEFEAFLLELLSEYAVTISELDVADAAGIERVVETASAAGP